MAGALVLFLAIAWGARLTALEGFIFASSGSRSFGGDFNAAMYHAEWWDGTGIMYGPVFVMERWLVNGWPVVFTNIFFALANIPLVLSAFALGIAAVRGSRSAALVTLAAWLCFRPLFDAFSVAANPEILELFFLSVAWFAASRIGPTVAWTATAIATLTKVIPVTFAPLLLSRASRRAILVSSAAGAAIVVVVGFGQHLGPLELVRALLIPSQTFSTRDGQVTLNQAEAWVVPRFSSQFLGLSSALMRAMGLRDGDPSLGLVQSFATVVTVLVYLFVASVALRLLLGRHRLPEITRLSLSYGMFFAMMPLTTFNAHLHTFVFLLPTWTAIVATVIGDDVRRRAFLFGILSVLVYAGIGIPGLVTYLDRLMRTDLANAAPFTDPIWADLALIGLLSAYALARMREGAVGTGPNANMPMASTKQSALPPVV